MIRTEMGGGTTSLNMGPISLGIWGLVGALSPMLILMGLPGPMSLGKWGWEGGGSFHYYIIQSRRGGRISPGPMMWPHVTREMEPGGGGGGGGGHFTTT